MIQSLLRSPAVCLWLAAALARGFGADSAMRNQSEDVIRLEEFIATESALADAGDVLPTSRPFFSVFGTQSILDVPRSALVLTPEHLRQFDIQDFADLGKVGAGTQQVNYYGIPGTPVLRSARGAVYFNGVQRAYQRNEMPLSFGSVEAMDVVRGPAPAHFGAGMAGGYVNLIPKSPFFDRRRGSLQLEIGQYDHFRAQLDAGGPLLLGDRPAAFRISVTGQKSGSYYDRVDNDFVSLYGALKLRLAPDVSLSTGAEFFDFNSNENAGWNRVTQRLIDSGEYVIGEPLSIVSPAWGGVAARNLISRNPALVVPTDVVAAGVASGFISAAQRDAMLDLSNVAGRAQAYANFSSAELTDIQQSTSGFLYTPEYFDAGGAVFTQRIDGSAVLSDERDRADSRNFLYFLELDDRRRADTTLNGKLLVDALETDKLSTYGYAIQTRQLHVEAKGTVQQRFPIGRGMDLTYGVSARFADAKMLQDFFVEPFSRRDIAQPTISPNTVILSGPQRGPDGRNFWSPTSQGGANAHSHLWQFSAFGYAINRLTERLTTTTSLLVAHAPYRTTYPPEVDLVSPDDPRRAPVKGHRNFYNASISPVLAVARGVNLYATLHYGTSLDPLIGGSIIDRGNFARNRLAEVGLKTSLLEEKLFTSLAAYHWRQTRYDERTNAAELYDGDGIELELTWRPAANWAVIASANHQDVQRLSPLPPGRSIPFTEEQFALAGGVFNRGTIDPPSGNPARDYAGAPPTQLKLFAIWSHPTGFGISGGVVWSDAYWHNFDHTLRLPATNVWNLSVFYRASRYELALMIENLTDEDYFLGSDPGFAANTLITKAPERSAKVSWMWKF